MLVATGFDFKISFRARTVSEPFEKRPPGKQSMLRLALKVEGNKIS